MSKHIIPIVALIAGLSFVGQYTAVPNIELLVIAFFLIAYGLSHFRAIPVFGPVAGFLVSVVKGLLGFFVSILASFAEFFLHPVTGARFMLWWQQPWLLNRWHKGFLLNGKHARLSEKKSFESVVTVGGMGRGKSSTFVMPNLFTLDDCSMVVTDTSGEIFEQTSGYLQSKGYTIRVLNLMDTSRSIGYNPLANAKTHTDIHKIAHLIIRSANPIERGEPIWTQGAEKFVRIFAQCLINRGDVATTNLPNVKHLINNFDAHLGTKDSAIDRFVIESTLDDPSTYSDYKGLILGNDRTVASFLSTADAALTAVGNPEIARLLTQSTFDFQELREKKTALYVMVRQQDIDLYGFVLNLFFTDLFNSLLHNRTDGLPVYMLLDEFGHLTIPNFDVFATTARKYRVGFWLFLQSLSQLESRYGVKEARTVLDGIQSEVYMSGLSMDIAKELSERIGARKIPVQQYGGRMYKHEERLVDPADIIRMRSDESLYFYANTAPIRLSLKPYFKQRRFRLLSEMTPAELPELPILHTEYVDLNVSSYGKENIRDQNGWRSEPDSEGETENDCVET